jgi:release factor glutamine methyltransferase
MAKKELPSYEQELILSHILKKSREHVLTHPEMRLDKKQEQSLHKMSVRRVKNEPLAYILSHKEFYGLDFKVTRHTLIPRPETELIVEEIIKSKPKNNTIIDVGTGSGNIIISLCKNIRNKNNYYGIDISPKALRVAKYNAKKNKVGKRIKFIKSDLLDYFIKHQLLNIKQLIIVANLPYLSKEIYKNTLPDVKNYEPKIALLSKKEGMYHHQKLFNQIKTLKNNCSMINIRCLIEFSPEQKLKLEKLVQKYFPGSKPDFQKDLAWKWRIASFSI